jgi:hypothetical protein
VGHHDLLAYPTGLVQLAFPFEVFAFPWDLAFPEKNIDDYGEKCKILSSWPIPNTMNPCAFHAWG